MIHLVVVVLSGCGRAGVVHSAAPRAQLVVRLLVETEKRRRPRTETVGLLEHSQRELLKNQKHKCSTSTRSVTHIYFILQRRLFYPKGNVPTLFSRKCLRSMFHFCSFIFFPHFSSYRRSACTMSKHKDGHSSDGKVIPNHTHRDIHAHTHHSSEN